MVRFPHITHIDDLAAAQDTCSALAGPAQRILALARKIRGGRRAPLRISHAILPSTAESGRLDDDDRDLLWDTFGVPVFEQLHDASGRLIAAECDAHDGLHLIGGEASESDVCPCGWSGARMFIGTVSPSA